MSGDRDQESLFFDRLHWRFKHKVWCEKSKRSDCFSIVRMFSIGECQDDFLRLNTEN